MTPPICCASAMRRSAAPARAAACISSGPAKFSPSWIGVRTAVATAAHPGKSSARTGSSIQLNPSSSSARPRAIASRTVRLWLKSAIRRTSSARLRRAARSAARSSSSDGRPSRILIAARPSAASRGASAPISAAGRTPKPLPRYARTGFGAPPSRRTSGTDAARARASHAAMSTPESAMPDRPRVPRSAKRARSFRSRSNGATDRRGASSTIVCTSAASGPSVKAW